MIKSNLLRKIFERNKEKELVIDCVNKNNYTYYDFFNYSVEIVKKLENKGIKEDDFVFVYLDNSANYLMIYLAAMILGFIVVPIDKDKGKDEIKYIIQLIKNKAIIYDKEIEIESPIKIEINELKINENEYDFDYLEKINYEKLFMITFTSGSTGNPKGVKHSVNNLILSANAFKEKFNFDSKIFYNNFSMSYMAGILNTFILPLISESKIVVNKKFQIKEALHFWKEPIKQKVNVFWMSPTMLSIINKLDRGFEGQKYCEENEIIFCVGTAPLRENIKENFENRYHSILYESYGLSETLFVSTQNPNSEEGMNVGEILNGVQIKNKEGELLINVPWMYLGYIGANDNDYFIENFYKSGDIGEIKEGILKITERKKNIIIRGGVNISPKKIEDYLYQKFNFEEISIIGLPDKILGEKIVCFHTNAIGNISTIKEKIKELGRDYNIDEFIKIDEMPKNINGKIDKLKLKKWCKSDY